MSSSLTQRLGLRVGLWYVKRRVRKATVDRRSPTLLGKLQWLGAGAGLAFAAGALLKPKRRGSVGQAAERATAAAAGAASTVKEKAAAAAPAAAPGPEDLASAVEQVVAGTDGVTASVEDGIAFLRGEVDSSATIAELVASVERVEGVRAVQSLLTLPGSPAAATSVEVA